MGSSRRRPVAADFDTKRDGFDWNEICWCDGEWSARYRDVRDAVKYVRVHGVDPLHLVSRACTRMLTEWVVAWYLPALGRFERTREQIIDGVLHGNPTAGRLAELVRHLKSQPYFERPLQAGRTLMRDLIRAGLLKRNGKFIDVTEAGVSFSMKSLKRRITRKKADALVRRLLERVEAFNASDDEVVRITRVILFGSYLDPSVRNLGDVDVAFEYEYRPVPETHDDWASWLAAEVERRTGKRVGRVELVRDGHGTKLTLGAVVKVLRVNNDISPHSLTDDAIFAEKPEMKLQLIYNDGQRCQDLLNVRQLYRKLGRTLRSGITAEDVITVQRRNPPPPAT